MFSSKFNSLSVILSHLYEPNNIDHIDQWYTTKSCSTLPVNTLRPRQNGRHFPDDFFKRISLNEIVWISIKISLNFVPRVPINNIPALVQIMACRRPGAKPLSEPMMVSLLTHLCVARPQGVENSWWYHAVVRVDSESTKINSNQSNYIASLNYTAIQMVGYPCTHGLLHNIWSQLFLLNYTYKNWQSCFSLPLTQTAISYYPDSSIVLSIEIKHSQYWLCQQPCSRWVKWQDGAHFTKDFFHVWFR